MKKVLVFLAITMIFATLGNTAKCQDTLVKYIKGDSVIAINHSYIDTVYYDHLMTIDSNYIITAWINFALDSAWATTIDSTKIFYNIIVRNKNGTLIDSSNTTFVIYTKIHQSGFILPVILFSVFDTGLYITKLIITYYNPSSVAQYKYNSNPKLIGIYDLMGKEAKIDELAPYHIYIYKYDNGFCEKKLFWRR